MGRKGRIKKTRFPFKNTYSYKHNANETRGT